MKKMAFSFSPCTPNSNESGSKDAVPDLASSPQPTNQGAEKRSKREVVEGAAAAATACATAARDDEAHGRSARHARAGSRVLADHAAGSHRTSGLKRDRTQGEARTDNGARGRRLHLAHHIRYRHNGTRRGWQLHLGLGRAPDHAGVNDRYGHAERGMVVGELQITALADIQRGTDVIHQFLAVEPRLEEAVYPGGPLHLRHEVV